jgi:hypothetical protein
MKNGNTKAGRVILHLKCAWKDHYWVWHWQGIKREAVEILNDSFHLAPSPRPFPSR